MMETNNHNNENKLSSPLMRELTLSMLWVKFSLTLSSSILSARSFFSYLNEKQKQKNSTQMPIVFRQRTQYNDALSSLMSAVLQRSFRPTLFMDTFYSSNNKVERSSEASSCEDCVFFLSECVAIENIESLNNSSSITFHLSSKEDTDTINLHWFFPKHYLKEENPHAPKKKDSIPTIHHPVILFLKRHREEIHCNIEIEQSMQKSCLKYGWIVVDASIHYNDKLHRNEASEVEDHLHSKLKFATNTLPKEESERMHRRSLEVHIVRLAIEKVVNRAHNQPIFLLGTCSISNDLIATYLDEECFLEPQSKTICGAITVGNDISRIKTEKCGKIYSTGSRHISIPFLQLITSATDKAEKTSMHHTFRNHINNQRCNPNIILVNVKMGNQWQWNVSRKYGFDELFSSMRLLFQKRGISKQIKWADMKQNWADRVCTKFIKAVLTLEQKEDSYRKETNSAKMNKNYLFIPSKL